MLAPKTDQFDRRLVQDCGRRRILWGQQGIDDLATYHQVTPQVIVQPRAIAHRIVQMKIRLQQKSHARGQVIGVDSKTRLTPQRFSSTARCTETVLTPHPGLPSATR